MIDIRAAPGRSAGTGRGRAGGAAGAGTGLGAARVGTGHRVSEGQVCQPEGQRRAGAGARRGRQDQRCHPEVPTAPPHLARARAAAGNAAGSRGTALELPGHSPAWLSPLPVGSGGSSCAWSCHQLSSAQVTAHKIDGCGSQRSVSSNLSPSRTR